MQAGCVHGLLRQAAVRARQPDRPDVRAPAAREGALACRARGHLQRPACCQAACRRLRAPHTVPHRTLQPHAPGRSRCGCPLPCMRPPPALPPTGGLRRALRRDACVGREADDAPGNCGAQLEVGAAAGGGRPQALRARRASGGEEQGAAAAAALGAGHETAFCLLLCLCAQRGATAVRASSRLLLPSASPQTTTNH